MQENKVLQEKPKPGQTWKTAKGHQVKISVGPRADVIETAYLPNGTRVNNRLGINFDTDGRAISGDDWLVERVQ